MPTPKRSLRPTVFSGPTSSIRLFAAAAVAGLCVTTLNLIASISVAKAAGKSEIPLSAFVRLSQKPVLEPSSQSGYRDAGAFNPAAAKFDGKTVLLFRAQDKKGTSSVGYAESSDGIHFKVETTPVFFAEESYEKPGGVEDPRLLKIDDTYYLTYTGYNGKDAQLCLATSRDLRKWQRVGVIMPANKGTWNKKWTKSGAIVPQKIGNKYWMYYLGTVDETDQMGVASSDDLVHWKDATDKPVLPRREKMFDSRVVEPGPAPIVVDRGILLIYNGADDKLVYRVGWVLFDKKDPTRVIARSEKPIFAPELAWEKVGQVPDVVFVEGLVQDGDRLRFYYGGADKCTGVAESQLLK